MPRIDYEELYFENAYVYRKCAVPLAKQGLVLVRGLNLDDGGYLGSGKSSLFEMFAQVQMGKGGKRDQRRGDLKSEIVNIFADDGLTSKLRLRVDGHPYEIVFYRKHHRFGNSVQVLDRETGLDILPRESSRSPFKWIREKLLQLDETSFFNLVYLGQELNNVMVHGVESDRRQRLTVMFGLDFYDEMRTIVKKHLSINEAALSDFDHVRSELEEIQQKLEVAPDPARLDRQVEAAKRKLLTIQAEYDADMDEYTRLADVQSKLSQRTELRAKIMRLFRKSDLFKRFAHPKDVTQVEVTEYKQQCDIARAELVSARRDLLGIERRLILQAQLQKLSGRSPEDIQTDLSDVKVKLTTLNKVELPQAEERMELLSKLQQLTEPTADLVTLEREHDDTITDESRLRIRINALDSQVKDAVCPHCNRPYDMTVAEIAEIQAELSIKRDLLEQTSQNLHSLKKQISSYRAIQQIKSKLKGIQTVRSPDDVMKDIRMLTSKERTLAGELEISQQKLRYEVELKSLPVGNKGETEEQIKALEDRVERLNDCYHTATFIVDKLADLKLLPSGNTAEMEKDLRKFKERLKSLQESISAATVESVQLGTYATELRALQQRFKALKKVLDQKTDIAQETECLRVLNLAFGPSGLKQDRFHAILSDATDRTVPVYTDMLWHNRNVALSLSDTEGSLQFQLDRLDSSTSVKSSLLSGGERHKAGLAFLFGMRDLKELYTRSSTNVLIVDEPFGNMDPLGTEALISIFSRLRSKFESVFVISHRPEVLSHPVWDQTWWAIRENNIATLYTSDPPAFYQKIAAELVKQ